MTEMMISMIYYLHYDDNDHDDEHSVFDDVAVDDDI